MITFEAIGTSWSIDIFEPVEESISRLLKDAITERISVFDKAYSRFRSDSWVTEIARSAGTYTIPPDGEAMVTLYEKLYHLTGGAMTPLIGKALEEAGYDAHYSLVPKKMQAVPQWETTLEYSFPKLKVRSPVVLDFGAMGKGYLIDIVGTVIAAHGISNYCIDAGGDILYKTTSSKPLQIGLEHPENKAEVIGVATIVDRAICGSAGNRRKWAQFHHVINPHTLSSPKEIVATWVVADTALLADALTTALFFVSPEVLTPQFAFEYLRLDSHYQVEKSENFPATLYYKEDPNGVSA